MGNRFLYEQITHPLKDIKQINKRQDFIEAIKSDTMLLDTISSSLKNVSDVDAILNRLALGRALPRDLLNLKKSLQSILEVITIISQ